MDTNRFIVKYNYILRFIVMSLFAIILAGSIVFSVKALISGLSVPNRPIIKTVFERVEQDGVIDEGRPVYGERTFIPVILKNIGRKPALELSWRFDIEGSEELAGSRKEPLARKDSVILFIEKSPNPVDQWNSGILQYSIQYSDSKGNTYFKNDSLRINPLIGEVDRQKLGGLQPATLPAIADTPRSEG